MKTKKTKYIPFTFTTYGLPPVRLPRSKYVIPKLKITIRRNTITVHHNGGITPKLANAMEALAQIIRLYVHDVDVEVHNLLPKP